jgi:hypothetical protein
MPAWRDRWTTSAAMLGAGYLILCALYFYWTWSRELGDFGGDNAFYLLIARHYSFWSSADAVTQFFSTHSLYPPLYPMILSLFGGGESVLAAHLATTALLCLAFAAFYVWLRRLECPVVTAAGLVVLFALLPGTYMLALSILSEGTFLLFSLLAVIAVDSYEKSNRNGWLWAAAASVAAATLARSAGVALLAAYALYLLMHRPARFWVFGLVAAAPFVIWTISHQSSDVGYVSALLEKRPADLVAGIIEQLRVQALSLWRGWVWSFSDAAIATVVASVLALVGLAGTAVRVWRRKLDGIYAALYFALILIWPFPAEAARFVFVLIPFLLAHAWLLTQHVPALRVGKTPINPTYLVLLVLFLLVLPEVLLTAQRFVQPFDAAPEARRTRGWYDADPSAARATAVFDKALVDGMRAIPQHVPPGECVYSIKPSIVGFYSGRISVVPPREYLDADTFTKRLTVYGCRYFYTVGFASPSYRTPFYPMERLGRGRVLNVSRAPGHRFPVSILVERSDK